MIFKLIKSIICIVFIGAVLFGCNNFTGEAYTAARDYLKQKSVTPDSVNIIGFYELDKRDSITAAWIEWDQRNTFNANIRQRGLIYVDTTHRVILHSDECKFMEIQSDQIKLIYNSNDKFKNYVDLGFEMAQLRRKFAFHGK